ncbi:MAG: penicillin-binding protein [Vicinamibacteria bacterium]|nr:penicillin-binding protein [Vicinamibacteria bacterium]
MTLYDLRDDPPPPDPLSDAEPSTPTAPRRNPGAARLMRSLRRARQLLARHSRRLALFATALVLLPFLFGAGLIHRVYFDRSGVPDLDAFVRFDTPTTGTIQDARGEVLIELAHEYRRVITYDEVPLVLRQAILATEDKNFFSHAGVEYRSLPRVLHRAAAHTLAAWWDGGPGSSVRLPQGGSTLTQQLVRGYFLRSIPTEENGTTLLQDGWTTRLVAVALGVPAANKLYRKLEEVRLALWLEDELERRYGSREAAKREIFARYASFVYLGHGRYGFAAASEYYFGKPLARYTAADAGRAALLAGISKSPRDYAPAENNPMALRRRDEILELMVRRGDLTPEVARLCQSQPVVLAKRSDIKTDAPAAIETAFDEIKQRGGHRFTLDDLLLGRIRVRTTIDERVQTIVNQSLERGLSLYERRHPKSKGLIQGSVVVLANGDAAILAQAGGRQVYRDRANRYFDLNRATRSLRQPGSAWKPLVYLAAFRNGVGLDASVPDDPIAVPDGPDGSSLHWISNYDGRFKGPIPVRQALAESRNAVAVWLTRQVGLSNVIQVARRLGVRSPIQPYISTALGASEVRLLELSGVYRAMASGVIAEPYVVAAVTDNAGQILYEAPQTARDIRSAGIEADALLRIQEGLRGVVRLPNGTASSLNGRDFPIPVMGKTGTTSDFRDALFVGSTYGPTGITVAVRIGFDDNRALGNKETGARAALPIFREIVLRIYKQQLAGPVPRFPQEIEDGIDAYLAQQADLQLQEDEQRRLEELQPLVAPGLGAVGASAPVLPLPR